MDPGSQPEIPTPRNKEHDLDQAAKLLSAGEVIVFPTETFYGLVASAFSGKALAAVQKLKGRSTTSPLPCLIGDTDDLPKLARRISDLDKELIARFWPGPLTLVFDAVENLPEAITAGTGTVGVRVPGHNDARRLARMAGPLVATSANRSGENPVVDGAEAKEKFPDLLVFDEGSLPASKGSTVLDLRQGPPKILRHGDIPVDALAPIIGDIGQKAVS
jgi:L-threonylcarbamoyladenylate synthase